MTHGSPSARPPRPPLFTRRPEGERRSPAVLLGSIAVHVLVLGGLVHVIMSSTPVGAWLRLAGKDEAPVVEKISFLQLPKGDPSAPPTPGRAGGNGRPATNEPPPAPIVAPREVPTGVPPVSPNPRPTVAAEEAGTGPLVGGGGPTRGIRPNYNDPRIWGAADAPIAAAPKTSQQRLDSVIVAEVRKFRDSVDANTYEPNKFERGDWTKDGPGGKWGVDKQYIRLGKVSIPTAVLGLLPLNVTNNPQAYERGKAMAAMRSDILEHAQSQMTEDEFKRAVKRIRERKERERREGERTGKPVAMPEGR